MGEDILVRSMSIKDARQSNHTQLHGYYCIYHGIVWRVANQNTNNMRILLSLIFALAGFSAFSQTYPPMTMGSKLYEFKNGARFDSAAFLPRRDTTNADATMLAPGMLQWRPADQSFYGRDS